MEKYVMESLKTIGYEGRLKDETIFLKALADRSKSLEYTLLVHILAEEINILHKMKRTVNIMNYSNKSTIFLLELRLFLKELGCPYKKFVTGSLCSYLNSKEDCLLLLDFLLSELMTIRLLNLKKFGLKDVAMQGSPTAKNLKDALVTLKFNKPPSNISLDVLLSKFEAQLKKALLKEGEQLVGKPLYNKEITEKDWKVLEETFKKLFEDYRLRREILIKNLDCTVQSMKEFKQSAYRPIRENLKVNPEVALSDVLAARTSILQFEIAHNSNTEENKEKNVTELVCFGKDLGGGSESSLNQQYSEQNSSKVVSTSACKRLSAIALSSIEPMIFHQTSATTEIAPPVPTTPLLRCKQLSELTSAPIVSTVPQIPVIVRSGVATSSNNAAYVYKPLRQPLQILENVRVLSCSDAGILQTSNNKTTLQCSPSTVTGTKSNVVTSQPPPQSLATNITVQNRLQGSNNQSGPINILTQNQKGVPHKRIQGPSYQSKCNKGGSVLKTSSSIFAETEIYARDIPHAAGPPVVIKKKNKSRARKRANNSNHISTAQVVVPKVPTKRTLDISEVIDLTDDSKRRKLDSQGTYESGFKMAIVSEDFPIKKLGAHEDHKIQAAIFRLVEEANGPILPSYRIGGLNQGVVRVFCKNEVALKLLKTLDGLDLNGVRIKTLSNFDLAKPAKMSWESRYFPTMKMRNALNILQKYNPSLKTSEWRMQEEVIRGTCARRIVIMDIHSFEFIRSSNYVLEAGYDTAVFTLIDLKLKMPPPLINKI